ncbi:hypothetical protein ILUMI_21120 [Ignelater luminosus]|uniref:C-CAP/cofactor C-like domain-containing protein n=1 Tax=Ignelater luminosus TaxID=2038154 RepID=A0A8K0CCT3_IGNLU|nr:hypothetical protein ILUMI_21120 [Ignelater luminosus]
MDFMQERCDKITNLLNRRELERKLDIEKKRENKRQGLAEHENIDFFEKTFTAKKLEIENDLNSSLTMDSSKLANHFDMISKNILNLQKYVAASNLFLRTYDIKVCHQSLQELSSKARELEEKVLPKKKFGFKKKTMKSPPKHEDIKLNGHAKDEVDFCRRFINLNDNFCGYENKINETLVLENSKVFKKDVTLKDLECCVIKIYGTPSTIHMNHLKNCLILSGPVSTSIFAENCTNCKLVIACQQLRLHSSSDVHIYLHVTSRAIMEDCKRILIAPYNYKYDGMEDDFIKSGLDINTNNWTSIDDFNWLNTEIQSPNWNILKEIERVNDWNNFSLPSG